MLNVTFGIAFLAGLVSFLSPCVLPLVPAYIGYMSGRVTHTVAAQVAVGAGGTATLTSSKTLARLSTLIHGMAFVSGFALIFITIGLLGTALIGTIGTYALMEMIGRIGGVITIFFGLHFMGVMPSVFRWIQEQTSPVVNLLIVLSLALFGSVWLLWGFTGQIDVWNSLLWERDAWAPALGLILTALFLLTLFLSGAFTAPHTFLVGAANRIDNLFYADTRRQMATNGGNLGTSMLMGVVFAAGWTPCIGPVYGTILNISMQTGDVSYAVPLLGAYALGLGTPFLLCALLLDGAQGLLRRLQRNMRTIKVVSGAFLILIGVLVTTGQLQSLSATLNSQFGALSIQVESCVVGWAEGDVYFNQVGDCVSGAVDVETLKARNGLAG